MVKDLVTSSCEACRADAPVLEDNEIQELLSQIPSWRVFEEDDIKKICDLINFHESWQNGDFSKIIIFIMIV